MINTLPESFNTFFTFNKKTVSSLIKEMKLDKTDINALASRLNSGQKYGDFNGVQVAKYAQIEREPVAEFFRESAMRIKRLYNASNASGLILDSIVSVISSEIEKVENDINDLELFINNYEFIAGKDDLYNSNYIEKFDNLFNDYKFDGYNFSISDRDNVPFPKNGNVFIDSANGVMKIGIDQVPKNVIRNIKSINITNNYSNYITTDSDFKNLFNDTLVDSWNITIKSPTILNSTLSDYSKYITYSDSTNFGATTAVEIEFHSAIDIDSIKLIPNLGSDLQLKQVVVFDATKSNSSNVATGVNYVNLLDDQKVLNNKLELNFNTLVVNKVIFIFNQTSYTRSKKTPISSELNSKAMQSFIDQRLNERKNRFSVIQDIAYWYFKRRYSIDGLKTNKSSDIEYYSNKFPDTLKSYLKYVEDEIFKASNLELNDRELFTTSPIFIELIKNMMNYIGFDSKFYDSTYFVESNSKSRSNGVINYSGFLSNRSSDLLNDPKMQFYYNTIEMGSIGAALKQMLTQESEDSYEYNFSLKSIEFSKTNTGNLNKACFVSRKIPTDGQVLGVKAKLESLDNIVVSTNSNFDLKAGISYELSISNTDTPSSEADWFPLAFNDSSTIDSEVVFFDVTNYSYKPRFTPRQDSIILFKDGKIVSPFKYRYTLSSGIFELLDTSVYSPTSTFCIGYTINDSLYDPFELDFIKNNLYKESVKQYSSINGMGQVFGKTNADATIKLDYIPYINSTSRENANYDKFYGTIFTDNSTGYSPVKVKLADGSFATNLTNYSNSAQSVSFFGANSIQFIQNGKSIVFNKYINTSFTVYYEYIPNSVRFRLIMRKNIPNIDMTGKADTVLLKIKTVHFDPYYDKLNYISKN